KFKRFAMNVWGISDTGRTDEETACAGVEALAGFARKVGLPATLQELGVGENMDLKEIASSCGLPTGCSQRMTQEEILEIFKECL
ncbi:MAG: iron-containing alcohol dehydrogenase, partial [Lachnospiraceae bacterium]|nr:iron-containing alcohol dehydrogenase [Lachnospiraceae bacterium]